MRRILIAAVIAGVGLFGATNADATLITQSFTFPADGGVGIPGIPQFNPALGTLKSITVTTTGSATFTGGSIADRNVISYSLNVGPVGHSSGGVVNGPGTVTTGLDFSPTDLGDLTGTGLLIASVAFTFTSPDPAVTVSNTFSNESVIYNYTPAAVSEPASLPVFVLGLLGLSWLYRRRVRGAA